MSKNSGGLSRHNKKPKPVHYAADFGLDVLSGDDDLFRWFLLSFLFGKPIQSTVAARTWQIFIDRQIDTPWAIVDKFRRSLVRLLDEGSIQGMTKSLHARFKCACSSLSVTMTVLCS